MIYEVKKAGMIIGIASVLDEMFVLRYGADQVEVYDSVYFELERNIDVPNMQWARNMAACRVNGCLYITDSTVRCVHRVDISTNVITKLSVDGFPFGVSVTNKNDILVTFDNVCRSFFYLVHKCCSHSLHLMQTNYKNFVSRKH